MIVATIGSVIERRLLVNYRVEPAVAARLLPPPFRPQLVNGMAVAGVCFLRLARFRPPHLPPVPGLATENAAHRIAVEWDDDEGTHAGVYIPRRDSNSMITVVGGGTIFPARHHLARFTVDEPGGTVRISVSARDRQVRLAVTAAPATTLASELFDSVDEARAFFREGALGFAPAGISPGRLDKVRLHSDSWAMEPMTAQVRSSLYDDLDRFPPGTCTLDSALIMRNLNARWTAAAG